MIFSKRMKLAERVDKYLDKQRIAKNTLGVITALDSFRMLKEYQLYWKHRCQAAEEFIEKHPADPDINKEQHQAYLYWLEMKEKRPEDYV